MDHNVFLHRQRTRRRFRVRKRINGTGERPRLSVQRSLKHIYCQLIDDETGKTLLSASSREAELRSDLKTGGNVEAATRVGKLLGERAKASGITAACFDRGEYRYHGRVAAIAEAVRETGIAF